MDPKKIEELKAQHAGKELHLLTAGDGTEVVIRKPTPGDMRRWRSETADANKRSIANENIVRSCVVHPPPTEFRTLLDEMPGYVEEFAEPVLRTAGMSGQATAQKL